MQLLDILTEHEHASRTQHAAPDLRDLLDQLARDIAEILTPYSEVEVRIQQVYSEHPAYEPIRLLIFERIRVRFTRIFQPRAMSEIWTSAIIRNALPEEL